MRQPRPVAGLFAGIAAGLAAAAVMTAFQAVAQKAMDDGSKDEDDDPATVKAADRASEIVAGRDVPEPYRDTAGQVVHYVVGAALGGAYGLLAEYRPGTSAGFGSAYGLATSLLLDEGAVPAAGLSDPAWETPLSSHAYGVVSHLVYGVALEGTRRLLRRPK